jgi:hypothetical protein
MKSQFVRYLVVTVFAQVFCSGITGCHTASPTIFSACDYPKFNHTRMLVQQDGRAMFSHGTIYVPANEEWVFTESVEIRAFGGIVIDGVIRGLPPQDPSAPARTMKLESVTGITIRGKLLGFAGADGLWIGQDGGTGGTLILRAPMIVLSTPLVAPAGGHGAPGGGTGGTGGRLEVYASAVAGPYQDGSDAGVMLGIGNLIAGRGGAGGPPLGSLEGGSGGNGGSAISGLFREVPWMVEYREYYQLQDREIEAARERGEID